MSHLCSSLIRSERTLNHAIQSTFDYVMNIFRIFSVLRGRFQYSDANISVNSPLIMILYNKNCLHTSILYFYSVWTSERTLRVLHFTCFAFPNKIGAYPEIAMRKAQLLELLNWCACDQIPIYLGTLVSIYSELDTKTHCSKSCVFCATLKF